MSSHLKYWNVNNLYEWTISQNLPLGTFTSDEETSEFNKDFIKSCKDKCDVEYFLEVGVQYFENFT